MSLLVNNLKNLKVALQKKKRKRERTVERWYLGTTSTGNKEIFSSTEDTLQAPEQVGHREICSLTEHMSTGSCWDRWENRLLDFASSFVRMSHLCIPVLVLCSSFPCIGKQLGKKQCHFFRAEILGISNKAWLDKRWVSSRHTSRTPQAADVLPTCQCPLHDCTLC